MIRLLAILLLFAPSVAMGATCTTTGTGGNWTASGTWTGCTSAGGVGGNTPGVGDDVIVSAGDTLTLDAHGLVADTLNFAGSSAAITCTSGATASLLDWTPTPTGTQYYIAEYSGTSGGAGTSHATAKDTWANGIALGGSGDTVTLQKGGHYDPADFDGEGKDIGSYGLGTYGYGPRALLRMDATETVTQTGASGATLYHIEIGCGEVLTAEPIMDRTSCVAPCAIEFKLDVDHTWLTGYEPSAWELPGATPTEAHGGEDWIFPETVWDFGDPGSGYWTTGARSRTTTPWPKNMEMPAPVAYHVYMKPGRYVAKSTTRYNGVEVVNSIPITISSPEAEWDDADTFCFANGDGTPGNGDDDFFGCPHDTDNDGICEDHTSNCVETNDYDVALNTTCDIDSDSLRCLFRLGDTFVASDTVGIDQSTDDWMVGGFGPPEDGPYYFIDGSAAGVADAVIIFGEINNGRFMDAHITGDNTTTDQKSLYFTTVSGANDLCSGAELDNLLIHNIYLYQIANGPNFRGNTSNGQWAPECHNDNLVISELYADSATTSSAGGVDGFMFAGSGAVLGGRYGTRQADEHGMRSKHVTDFLFSHMDMGRLTTADTGEGCGSIRHILTIRDGMGTSMIDLGREKDHAAYGYTQRFMVSDNFVGVCADNDIMVLVEQTSTGSDKEWWHSYRFFGNLFSGLNRADASSFTMLRVSGADSMTSNNAFYMDCDGVTSSCSGLVLINAKDTTPGTFLQRAHVINNSFWAPAQTTTPTRAIQIDSDMNDAFIANNIMGDLDSSTFIDNVGVGTIICDDGASTCNQQETTNPFASAIDGTLAPTLDMFKLNSTYVSTETPGNGIILANKAVVVDAFGDCRAGPTSVFEGIDEDGASPCLGIDNTDTNTLNSTASVGVNLQRNEEFQSAMPWANAMKMGREWQRDTTGTVSADCATSAGDYTGDLDDAGYPIDGLNGDFCVFTEIYPDDWDAHQWEGGTWSIKYDGTATAVFNGAASGSDCTTGDCTFTVAEGSAETRGIVVGFTTLTSLSNLRIYPPGGVCAASATAPYGGFQPWSYCDDTGSQTLIVEDTCSGDYASCVSLEDAAENGGLVFHPLFMKRMQKYRTVRLMDWMRTNNVADVTSGDTTVAVRNERDWNSSGFYSYNYNTRSSAMITPFGTNHTGNVPPEVAIDFCDQLGAECWVNIPHFATDAEIERLGRLCRDLTDLDCIFELSNETWNEGSFEQGTDASNAADAAYGNCSTGTAACRDAWIGNRNGEMCDLLEGVFDETGEDARMICLLATQGSSVTITDNRLDCDCGGGGCGTGAPTCDWTNLDGVAIALYFGVDPGDGAGGNAGDCDEVSPATVAGLSRTGGANSMAQYIVDRITGGSDWITAQLAQMAADSVPEVLYVYEGGTNYGDTTSNGGLCLDAMTATCTPGTGDCIYDQYEDALDGFEAHAPTEDVRAFVTFTSHSPYSGAVDDNVLSTFGNRGNWTGDQSAWPKEDAILDWSAANPCWWSGCELRSTAGGVTTLFGPWRLAP